MRRFGVGVAVVMLIALGHLAPANDVVAPAPVEVEVVVQLVDARADAPMRVAFGYHGPFHLVERGDLNFAPWLSILQRSLKDGNRRSFGVV
jgi:hypothetical protein